MNSKVSRRCALGAFLSLVAYGLSCVYPAAWSPDSRQVVFPVFVEENRIARLVMTDLACEPVREVARVRTDEERFGPASWSPDGRWIAYVRFAEAPNAAEEDAPPVDWELHVQDAASGEERTILRGRTEQAAAGSAAAWPPLWVGSDTLAVRGTGVGVLTLVNRQGEVLRTVDLPEGKLAAETAVLSPDGQRMAWVGRVGEEEIALFVRPVADDEEPDIFGMTASEVSDDAVFLRPAWSGDGGLLYIADARGPWGAEEEGLLRCLDVGSRQVETLWSRERAAVLGVDVSGDSGLVALTIQHGSDDTWTIEVLDPEKGQSTVVHATSRFAVGTAISPDGRWVAFCPALEDDALVGAIVSADGDDIRFFVPEGAPADAAEKVVRDRVKTSLDLLDVHEEMRAAGLDKPEDMIPDNLPAALEVLDRLAAGTHSALYHQALAYARARLHLSVLEGLPSEERAAFAPRARAALDHFAERYPGHPLLPELREELEAALPRPADPEEVKP